MVGVSALALPGFAPGEPAPGSWDAAIGALAAAARRAAGEDPLVLVGYSVGGVMAQAVAARLEADGAAPAGVVLIDTFDPDGEDQREVFGWAMGQVLDRDHAYQAVDDAGLRTMGRYMRLLQERAPAASSAPALLVRAGRPDWRR